MADGAVASTEGLDQLPPAPQGLSELPSSPSSTQEQGLSELPPPPNKSSDGIGSDAQRIMAQFDPEWRDKMDATQVLNQYYGFEPRFAYDSLEQIGQVLYGAKLKAAELAKRLKDNYRAANIFRSRNELANSLVQRGGIRPEDVQKLQDMTKDVPQGKDAFDTITRQGLDFLYSLGYAGRFGLGAGLAAAGTTEVTGQVAAAGMAASGVGAAGVPLWELSTQVDAASAFASMFSVGMGSALSVDMGKQATGQAFVDLMAMKDSKGRTLDPNVAASSANVVGLVTESAMAATAAFGPTTQGIAKKAIQRGAMGLLVDGSFLKMAQGLLAKAGLAAGTMSAANVATETTNLLVERAAKDINNAVNGTTFTQSNANEVISRLKDATLSGAIQGLIFHAPEMGLEIAGMGAAGKPAIRLTADEAQALLKSGVTPESVRARQLAALDGQESRGTDRPSAIPPQVDPNTRRVPDRPQMQPVPDGHTLTPDGKIVPNTQVWNNKYGLEAYDEFKRDLSDTVRRANDDSFSEEQRKIYGARVRQMRHWHPEFTDAVDKWNKAGRPVDDPGPEGIKVDDAVPSLKAPGESLSVGESGEHGYIEARARARESADADLPGYDTGNPYLTHDVPEVPAVGRKMTLQEAMNESRVDHLDPVVQPHAQDVLTAIQLRDTNPDSMRGLDDVLDNVILDKDKKLLPGFTATDEKFLRSLAKRSASDLSEYERDAVRRVIAWADSLASRRYQMHWMNQDQPLSGVVSRVKGEFVTPRFWKGLVLRLGRPFKWLLDLNNQGPMEFSSMATDLERSSWYMETMGQSHELSNTHRAVRTAVSGELDEVLHGIRDDEWRSQKVKFTVNGQEHELSRGEILGAALLRESPRAWSAVLSQGVVTLDEQALKFKDSEWLKIFRDAGVETDTDPMGQAMAAMRKGIDVAHPMVNDVRMRMSGSYSNDRGHFIPFEQFNRDVHETVNDAVLEGLAKDHSVSRIGDNRASKIGPLQQFRPAEGQVVLRDGLTAFHDFADRTSYLVAREEWADKMQRLLSGLKDDIVSRFGPNKFENLVRHVNATLGGKTYEGQLESLFDWMRRAGAITAVAGRVSPVLKNFALAIRTLSFAGEHPGDWYRFMENIVDSVVHFREADRRAASFSPDFYDVGVRQKGSLVETAAFEDVKKARTAFSRFGQTLTHASIAPLKWASRNVVKWDINYFAKTLLSDMNHGRLREDFLTANWRQILDENGNPKSKAQVLQMLKDPETYRQMAGRWGEWVAMHSHATMDPETRSAMFNSGWAGRIIATLGSEVNAKTNLLKYRFLDMLYDYRKSASAMSEAKKSGDADRIDLAKSMYSAANKKMGRFAWTAAVAGIAESLLVAEIDHQRRRALGVKQPGVESVQANDPMIEKYFKTRWQDTAAELAGLASYGAKATFQTLASDVSRGPYASQPGSSNIVGGLAKSGVDFTALAFRMTQWKSMTPSQRATTLDRFMEALSRVGSAASGYPVSGVSDALAEVLGMASGYDVDPGRAIAGTGPLVDKVKQPGETTTPGTGR